MDVYAIDIKLEERNKVLKVYYFKNNFHTFNSASEC